MTLDRVLKFVVTLTLVCLLLQAVIGLLVRLAESAFLPLASAMGTLGGIACGLIGLAGLACFTAGILLRARHLIFSRDPRAARDRAARDRAVHTRVRRRAEHVPVHEPDDHQPDPDPAINEDDE